MKTIESGAICEACGTWNAIQYDVAQGLKRPGFSGGILV